MTLNGKQHVLAASMKGEGHYLPILQRIAGQLDAMLSHHSKVLVIRVDLHMKYFTENNKLLSDFFRKLKKKLKKKFGQDRVGYIWCREQGEAVAQHYHLALILNGNKNRYPHKIIQLIEKIWLDWEQPKPFTPKNCYYMIERGDLEAYRAAFDRMSYLAKVATKGDRSKSTNDYFVLLNDFGL